jgi:hypothetical protein
MEQKKQIKITQKMLDKIIPPINTIEEEMEFSKRCDEEYERSKQEILEIIKRNIEIYKDK